MQIKVKKITPAELKQKKPKSAGTPKKPSRFFRWLMRFVARPHLKKTGFSFTKKGLERLGKDEPCLILMNHSSFIDLEIAATVFYPRPLNIVTTMDAFIGKNWLMRQIGCIETRKFHTSAKLLREIRYALDTLKTSVLVYPEAGYTFDGTRTALPESLGKCVKLFGVPVVSVITHGAHLHQPLFNELRKRDLTVNAEIEYLLSPEEITNLSAAQINEKIKDTFSFDEYRYQAENGIELTEAERATGLHRILYKCPACLAEGKTKGEGTTLTCIACSKRYELTPLGRMQAVEGETEISRIPEWYAWQRGCVRAELEAGTYGVETPVLVRVMLDGYTVYEIGEGTLTHTADGFTLRYGDSGEFHLSPTASYSVNADLYWYQLGDTVCIGDHEAQFYCFPKDESVPVAKFRLAAEENYKLLKK